MRDLDLKTLRLFVAVCDCQNMARAAAHQHIEASAISKRIAQLESRLGAVLLERSRRGVRPTPAGGAVLEHARSVLFTLDRLVNDAGAFSQGVQGHVRLVASASAIAESLLDDIAGFMREPVNRNIQIDVEERVSRELVQRLREGMASVGICWNSVDLQGLEHRAYRSDRLALAVHPEHPLAARKSLRFEATLDFEHVGLPASSAVHALLQRAAARAGRGVVYRAIVSNFDAAFRVVAANLAISIVPVEVGGRYASLLGVTLVPLAEAWAQRQFVVCFQGYEALQPAARRIVDHLVARASEAAGGA